MRLALLAFLLLPLTGFAAPIPAGFPSTSLWLSKTVLVDGESVSIHTVLYNSSDTALSGDVVFLVDTEQIGLKAVTISPGTTQIVSQSWTAKEGEHIFSARLEGDVEQLAQTQASTQSITVAPKPPPPEAVTKTVEAATVVERTIASSTPIVQNVASSTFATTESIRQSAVRALEKLASSTAPAGEVLGAQDEQPSVSAEVNAKKAFDIGGWIQNIWQAMLGGLLFVFRSTLWFYVLLAAVLLFILMFIKTALSDRKRLRGR